jgi:Flp pilus assembly pilin Flp
MNLIARFVRETEGQDLVEYAVLAMLIALAMISAISVFGGAVSTAFGNIDTGLTTAS